MDNNHEQKAADNQAPKGVEDAAKEYVRSIKGFTNFTPVKELSEGDIPDGEGVRIFNAYIAGWQANQLPGVEECGKLGEHSIDETKLMECAVMLFEKHNPGMDESSVMGQRLIEGFLNDMRSISRYYIIIPKK